MDSFPAHQKSQKSCAVSKGISCHRDKNVQWNKSAVRVSWQYCTENLYTGSSKRKVSVLSEPTMDESNHSRQQGPTSLAAFDSITAPFLITKQKKPDHTHGRILYTCHTGFGDSLRMRQVFYAPDSTRTEASCILCPDPNRCSNAGWASSNAGWAAC